MQFSSTHLKVRVSGMMAPWNFDIVLYMVVEAWDFSKIKICVKYGWY